MKRVLIVLAAISLTAVAGLVGFILGGEAATLEVNTTVSRLSPDETILASLVEVSFSQSLGRRFNLKLLTRRNSRDQDISNSSEGEQNIFRSSEGEHAGSPGTERLIWSVDGRKLLLVGRHFFVKEDLFLDNGDQAFFLYDVQVNQGWCNSEAPASYPPLKAEMIEGVEFTEPVRLKKM